MTTTNRFFHAGLAVTLLGCGLPAAADQWPDGPDPAPAIARAEPGRFHLVGGRLFWSDHRLAGICADGGGRFAKLANSAVYVCDLS